MSTLEASSTTAASSSKPESNQSGSRPRPVMAAVVRNPLGLIALLWLLAVVIIAVAGQSIAPYAANKVNLLAVGAPWDLKHLLGTDALGRDVLSRLIVGTLPGVRGVLVASAVFLLVGVPLGILAGYYRGWFDSAVGRLMDIVMSLPGLIILLVVLAVFANNQDAAMAALGVLAAPGLIRIIRAVTYSVREELYISAARVFGLSDLRILVMHIWPRVRATVIVQLSLFAGASLAVQSGLAFLGFGPQPPDPSWGGMIGDASADIFADPVGIVPAGLAIGLTITAFGLLGNAVRDASSENWSRPQSSLLRSGKPLVADAGESKPANPQALVSVRNLGVEIAAGLFRRQIVRGVDLDIMPGETIGVVGESGCGKTLTTLGLIGALPPGARISSGSVKLDGRELMSMTAAERDGVRGKRIGYVSQEPMRALDPMFTIGDQLGEAVRRHLGLRGTAARQRVLDLLAKAKLPDPAKVAKQYPHQLSGGMAQRVGIALALAGGPQLLVADEPTTALDVTTQAEILSLLQDLQGTEGMATLLVTHDWGVVASLCDRVVVMYAGEVVENGPVAELFARPKHPYTAALLRSNPHVVLERGLGGRDRDGTIQKLPTIPGEVPSAGSLGVGCAFEKRCSYASAACRNAPIPLLAIAAGHETRCIHSSLVGLTGGDHAVV